MPSSIGNFKGCPVILFGSDNECLAEAVIKEHDRALNTIEISGLLDKLEQGCRLKVLIMHSSGAAEFSGTIIKSYVNEREIALYNERQREARGATRHVLNAPATIKALILKTGPMPFEPPIKAKVNNISRTGVLLQSPSGHFEVGSVLELHINIQGRDAILYATVVRMYEEAANDEAPAKDAASYYGCKFLFAGR